MRNWPAAFLCFLTLLPVKAKAQEMEGLDLQALPMPIVSTPFFGLRGGTQAPANALSFGIRSSYLASPLTTTMPSPSPDGSSAAVVDGALLTEITASTGFDSGIDVGIALGANLYQWGPGIGPNTGGDDESLPTFGMMDPRLEAGWAAIQSKTLGLRPYLNIIIPLGSASAFAGEDHFRFTLGAAMSGEHKSFTWGTELSFRYRSPVELSSTIWGSQLHIAGSILFHLSPDWLLGPELHLLPVLHSQPDSSTGSGALLFPAEALGSLRYQNKGWSLGASAGTGLPLSHSSANAGGRFTRGPTSPLFRAMLELRVSK